MSGGAYRQKEIPPFERDLFTGREPFTKIGRGEIGGKAHGLALIQERILTKREIGSHSKIRVDIPRLAVISTHFFDRFMEENELSEVAYSDMSDERIAHHFQKSELPADLCGDLWALIDKVHRPLAIRSSSLMEDQLDHPFAGIYKTKMIPNNQLDTEHRFYKLIEAIKYIYSSIFFRAAKAYMRSINKRTEDEKMAVIIQEVVGLRHADRFYPNVSGVGRSYNFYPFGHATPKDGIVSLALGLGKTIVDGGVTWSYSPTFPRANPPYASASDLMRQTQVQFWAVNMGNPPSYNPIKETEYLVRLFLQDAEHDETLDYLASTYVAQSDRIEIGIGSSGPRILNFAPLLQLDDIPFNPLIRAILSYCRETMSGEVEIEFAVTFDRLKGIQPRLSLLQMRRMAMEEETADFDESSFTTDQILIRSHHMLGSGIIANVHDVVYVKKDSFSFKDTVKIAKDIESMNRILLGQRIPYILIGFGRWGSSDPWLGIPVEWGHICGSRLIVEAFHPERVVEMSQGSHFFHNLSNLGVQYLSLTDSKDDYIDWPWLDAQPAVRETEFVRHVRVERALRVQTSTLKRIGVILK